MHTGCVCVVFAILASSFSFASSTTNARSFFHIEFINSVHIAKRIHSVIASLCICILSIVVLLRFSFKQVDRIARAILNNGQIEIYTNAFQITLIANKGHWPRRWTTMPILYIFRNKWKQSPIISFAMKHFETHRPNRINILSDELHTLRPILVSFHKKTTANKNERKKQLTIAIKQRHVFIERVCMCER